MNLNTGPQLALVQDLNPIPVEIASSIKGSTIHGVWERDWPSSGVLNDSIQAYFYRWLAEYITHV